MQDDIGKTAEEFAQVASLNPFLALDLGQRWGRELGKLETKLDNLDFKFDNMAKYVRATQAELTDFKSEMADFKAESKADLADFKAETKAEFRVLEARLKSNNALTVAVLAAVLAGIILQYFS